MPRFEDAFLLSLLKACAEREPEPLYPARYAQDHNIDRDQLDLALDELRRRGLVKLTDWVKGAGQGRGLTDAGKTALASGDPAPAPPPSEPTSTLDPTRNIYERGELVREALIHPTPPLVSRILLAINIVVFIGGTIYAGMQGWSPHDVFIGAGDSTHEVLKDLGGLHPYFLFHPEIGRPQFERLITHSFLHIGVLHLLMNMFFLFTLGAAIEAMWEWPRFLAIYFVAAFVGGCVVVISGLIQRNVGLTAGASGAMYGLFLSMIIWFWLNKQHLPEHHIQSMSRMLLPNIILMVAINFQSGISWQGHLGGAVGGLLTALLLHVQRFHPSSSVRILALALVPLVPLGFLAAMLSQAGWFAA